MATLNLIPNPLVLGAQVGVFLANLYVVKNLFVAPYLRVRDRREALTTGSKDQATKALADSEAMAKRIESRLLEAAVAAKAERERIRAAANERTVAALAAAGADARKQIAAAEQQIQQDLAAEKGKIPDIIRALTDDVYKIALS